jgi:cytoskeletal protein RodZ
MEDNFLNDVVPPAHKRSIRDIPIPGGRKKTGNQMPEPERKSSSPTSNSNEINLKIMRKEYQSEKNQSYLSDDTETEFDSDDYLKPKKGKKGKSHMFLHLVIFAVVLILSFTIVNAFSKVTIDVAPKKADLANQNLKVSILTIDQLENDSQLGYRKLEFSKTLDQEVSATGEEFIKDKAKGTITLFNEYSSETQKFIKNTRFRTPDGKIYRTPVSIEVPGYKKDGDKIIPGQVDVEVAADDFGLTYNKPVGTTFDIPAFEKQDSYEYFYAKAKTELAGGFDGIKKIVLDSEKQQVEATLKNNIIEALKNEIKNQIPNNLLVFYTDADFKFTNSKQEDLEDRVKLSIQGNVEIITIDKGQLSSNVALNNLNDYRADESIMIKNLDQIDMTLENEGGVYSLYLNGDLQFVWQNDINKLAKDVAGKHKNELKEIVPNFRGIETVGTDFFPIWNNTFPKNVDRIFINQE